MQNKTLNTLITCAFLILCIEISFNFPDLDQKFKSDISSKILLHRSILTHNFLLPLVFYSLTIGRETFWLRLYTIAVGIVNAVHLSFDLFPRRWWGTALIHVPYYNYTSELFSKLWIGVSIVISLYIVFLMIRNSRDVIIVFAGIALLFGIYVFQHQDESYTNPALAVSGSTGITLLLPTDLRRAARQFYNKRIQPRFSRWKAA